MIGEHLNKSVTKIKLRDVNFLKEDFPRKKGMWIRILNF